ncbi:MAG: hypothetical protein H6696_01600 [Deferribacteres bacterium]|nr:hypothetical protein [candidate division KSB1 bacterium]MCB9500605.1 hypothetical protein [Deferribacteres bacterium]
MKNNKIKQIALFTILLSFAFATEATAQVSIGADVVSRYVWRGVDYGNKAAIQPALAFTKGGFEVGAWGNFSIADGSANENDLYVSYATGPIQFIVTDYFFPGYSGKDAFFEFEEDFTGHIIEAGAAFETGALSVSAFYNFYGADTENSTYFELGYTLPYSADDVELGLTAGAGNGFYTYDTDFNVVVLGITASKNNLSASYIINPNLETSFLVFGYSF